MSDIIVVLRRLKVLAYSWGKIHGDDVCDITKLHKDRHGERNRVGGERGGREGRELIPF